MKRRTKYILAAALAVAVAVTSAWYVKKSKAA